MTNNDDLPCEIYVGIRPDTGRLDARYGACPNGDYQCITKYTRFNNTSDDNVSEEVKMLHKVRRDQHYEIEKLKAELLQNKPSVDIEGLQYAYAHWLSDEMDLPGYAIPKELALLKTTIDRLHQQGHITDNRDFKNMSAQKVYDKGWRDALKQAGDQ